MDDLPSDVANAVDGIRFDLLTADPRRGSHDPRIATAPTARHARDLDTAAGDADEWTSATHAAADALLREYGIDPDAPVDPDAWDRAYDQALTEARAHCQAYEQRAAEHLAAGRLRPTIQHLS